MRRAATRAPRLQRRCREPSRPRCVQNLSEQGMLQMCAQRRSERSLSFVADSAAFPTHESRTPGAKLGRICPKSADLVAKSEPQDLPSAWPTLDPMLVSISASEYLRPSLTNILPHLGSVGPLWLNSGQVLSGFAAKSTCADRLAQIHSTALAMLRDSHIMRFYLNLKCSADRLGSSKEIRVCSCGRGNAVQALQTSCPEHGNLVFCISCATCWGNLQHSGSQPESSRRLFAAGLTRPEPS